MPRHQTLGSGGGAVRSDGKLLVERAFRALNDRDRQGFVGLHHPHVALHVGGEELVGIERIADSEVTYFEAFDDLALTPSLLIAEGHLVASRWQVRGSHTGAFKGVPATGRPVEFTATGFFGCATR